MSQTVSTPTQPAGAPRADTLTVKVNGKPVTVPRTSPDPLDGKPVPTTMIQACFAAGAMVPHYCYHPKLAVAGNCRMCLVEFGTPMLDKERKPVLEADGSPRILKSPRPAIACATPLAPGMEIYTETPGVLQMRQGVLEALLVNHPLDCPICDQAGECKLQEYSMQHGQAASQFAEVKVHKPKAVDLGPRIMYDAERCILCSRCIRFTRDIAGDDSLGIVNRGGYNAISVFPGRPFDNNYTLNTVDLCPVGALTSKDFRFKMRVWFLKETNSLCAGCATGCNIVVGSRSNQVYRFVPRENPAVNSSWMCDAGRLNHQWAGRPDRLAEVRVRGTASTWAAALAELAPRLAQAAPESVAVIASARQTNEELYLLGALARKLNALTDSVPRAGQADAILVSADRNPNSNGARMFGIAASPMGSRLAEIAQAIKDGRVRTLLVFGEDVTQHGLDASVLSRLETLVVSDILPNPTTAQAHFLLPGCAYLEKAGSFTNGKNRVQRFWKAVEAPGDARPEWEVLHELVLAVTRQNGFDTLEGLFNQMAKETPALRGLTWAGLGDGGAPVPNPTPAP